MYNHIKLLHEPTIQIAVWSKTTQNITPYQTHTIFLSN